MPPRLACQFTMAETAVMAVIALQVCEVDACNLTLDHIAALAGVSRTSVRNALKQAKALGLIHVEERRLSAWRNLPHLITITSPEWRAWLRMRAKGLTCQTRTGVSHGKLSGGGRKLVRPTNTARKKEGFRHKGGGTYELFRGQTSPPARSQAPIDPGLHPRTRDAR